MSFGLLAHNNNGDTLIDSGFQNHVVAESKSGVGVGALGTFFAVTFLGGYDPSQQPLLFVRCTSEHIAFYLWIVNPTTHKITGAYVVADASTGTFDWKLLVAPGAVSSDTEGIRVFDGSSNVVFDSGLEYLPIVDAVTINPASVGAFSHASATTPFYCATSGFALWSHSLPATYLLGYKAVSGTGGDSGWCQEASRWDGTEYKAPSSCVLLVGDAG